jgi:hypothetical protein
MFDGFFMSIENWTAPIHIKINGKQFTFDVSIFTQSPIVLLKLFALPGLAQLQQRQE